jgi:hypothetical protein
VYSISNSAAVGSDPLRLGAEDPTDPAAQISTTNFGGWPVPSRLADHRSLRLRAGLG